MADAFSGLTSGASNPVNIRFNIQDGRAADDILDQPANNFDVVGIPVGQWSSHFCACWTNCIPSCLLAFFCPCVLWAQVAVRAQIPLLIGLKNTFACSRRFSAGLILVGIFVKALPVVVSWILIVIGIGLAGGVVFFVGQTRTAVKEKYLLPSTLPEGCLMWDMLLDMLLSIFCLPCVLSQMARHVFQYERLEKPVSLFMGDPYRLPPLPPLADEEQPCVRPERADKAGVYWIRGEPHPRVRDNRGSAHRVVRNNEVSNPAVAASAPPEGPVVIASSPVYAADGSAVVY
eukprot:scaffold1884_cov343-Ochromonas_danica.AAC.14